MCLLKCNPSIPTRFCRVYFNFFISVCIYIVYNFLVGHVFSINTTLLAFTGWESIGNSNWYIFTILVMYLIVYGIFNNDNDLDKNLFRFTLVVVIYGLIISRIKENFWVSTVLCFPAGMILKENENIISNFLNCKRRYILSICVLLSLIFLIYSLFGYSWIVYNFISILFILILIFLNKLYRLRNIVFIYISKYTFEIYIYQRIFFDLFRNMFAGKNVAIYFVTSVILTIIFSIVIKKTVDIMYRKLIGE
uniref:Acyltransferase 3 domain-containing protein n=1 Tax=Erysipelothrix tonsillarum TaxID=38402 RepID=A0A6S6I157_9FIRM|nr:hypothetical protein [Erysipelothrix tonsillarum]